MVQSLGGSRQSGSGRLVSAISIAALAIAVGAPISCMIDTTTLTDKHCPGAKVAVNNQCITDVDECAMHIDHCGADTTCQNTPGSFICVPNQASAHASSHVAESASASTSGTSATSGAGGAGGAGGDSSASSASASSATGSGGSIGPPPCTTAAKQGLSFSGGATYAWAASPVAKSFTLEAWIKVTSPSPAIPNAFCWQGWGLLYADIDGSFEDYGTCIVNDKFGLQIGPNNDTVFSTSSVVTGQWVHVAAVRNQESTSITVMVNGMPESTKAGVDPHDLSDPKKILIGANQSEGQFFVGVIDEIRIWNIPRTSADIVNTMHASLKGDEVGLVAYYRLDEGMGIVGKNAVAGANNDVTLGSGDGSLAPMWVATDDPVCAP
jgi:hypothetical protein